MNEEMNIKEKRFMFKTMWLISFKRFAGKAL
jgi:hypothetical protein